MSLRSVTSLVSASLALACATAREPGPPGTGSLALSGQGAESVIERTTTSMALDRITKRAPILDGVVRHGGTGRGTTIYVFDGGIAATHPELAGRVRRGFDAFPGTARICNPHGTAVAGAAAGATLGVAPAAEVVDVKIINCDATRGTVQAILDAARWVVNDHRLHAERPAIANWSFIVDTTRLVPEIDSAMTILSEAGILVVASAGNLDIDACKVWRGVSQRALVVGASALRRGEDGHFRDVRSPNTAWGPCVDLYAPGDSVPLPAGDNEKPTTLYWTGTSMAAGYVSGVAALMLEAHPSTDPRSLMRAIEMSATADAVEQNVDQNVDGSRGARGRLLYTGLPVPLRVLAGTTLSPTWRPAGW